MRTQTATSFRAFAMPASKKEQPPVKIKPHTVTEGPFLYGLQDLALFLRVSVNTACKIREKKLFPTYLRGKQFMFSKVEVLEGIRQK